MRKISADLLFSIYNPPQKNAVLVVDDQDKILAIKTRNDFDLQDLEIYQGILCPGFVNTHCHLELSHLKGLVAKHLGLPDFLLKILPLRKEANEETIQNAIIMAEQEMLNNGIVAVGDISSDTSTIFQKEKHNLKYHTFIEILNIDPAKANETFEKGLAVYNQFPTNDNGKSIVPHATYTVSPDLLKKIDDHANDTMLSIHMQESEDENQFFKNKTGKFVEIYKELDNDLSFFKPTGENALSSVLKFLSKDIKILLVHDTVSKKEDITWAHQHSDNIWWCFCPKANLYIENRIPDIPLFMTENASITIGTDSLTSNDSLSILEELKVISNSYTNISLETLLKWATLNGALALSFDKELGSFEINKKPGINLIKNIDLDKPALTENSIVEVLSA